MSPKLQQILIAAILLMYGYLYCIADYTSTLEPYTWNDSAFYIVEAIIFAIWATTMHKVNTGELKRKWLILAIYFDTRLVLEVLVAINGVTPAIMQIALSTYLIATIIIIITSCRWR